MNPQDLDKLFRDALSEGRAQPRPDSWARVAAGIPQAPVKPKRRVLWYRYAAAASVVLAAAGLWRLTFTPTSVAVPSDVATNLPEAPSTTGTPVVAAPREQAIEAISVSAARPASVGEPQPATRAAAEHASPWTLAYLEPLERSVQDDAVPLLKRRATAPEDLAVAERPVPRYRQLASEVNQVWSAVAAYRTGEAQPQVTVEVHVPASVLQRAQQTKMLAQNFNQSWSTFLPKRSL